MARIYVGNLPIDIKERELDDLFYKFGKIREIEIKRPNRPPAYAFIAYDDRRDAEEAIRRRDGYDFDGDRLRCEMSKDSRSRNEDRRGGGVGGKRRSDYRVTIKNLPKSCSWQDLKDYMRKAGDVVYADVDRDGGGVVEYSNRDDMEYAIKKLDDTEFKNPYDATFIRVYADESSSSHRSRSRSRSKSRDRSRSRDRRRRDSRSRSRSRSRSERSASSRSRSRSPENKGKKDADEEN